MQKSAGVSLLVLALTAALAACGGGGQGGGGGNPTSGPAPSPSPTPDVAVCNSARTMCFPTVKPSAVAEAPAKPKLIFLVVLDDADYNDFGYFSSDAVTPHIDGVAKSGVRLSRYYAGSTICSPSRAAMLTGQSAQRYGMGFLWGNKPHTVAGDFYYGERGLPQEDRTLGEALRAEGYKSLFVGKWHIGTGHDRFLPGAKGYDRFTVQLGDDPASGSFRALTENGAANVTTPWQSKYAADQIIGFLDERFAAGENAFVTWWPPEPHISNNASSNYFYVPPTFDRAAFERDAGAKSINLDTDRGKLISMLYSLDAQLGRVLEFIRQKNLYDDSLIIVTSDNGGLQSVLSPSRELRDGKGTLFEGGLRVPFAASWPRRFAAGTHTNQTFSALDLYPTILGLIGGNVPAGLEGENLASVLLRGTGTRGPLFFQVRQAVFRRREDESYYDSFAYVQGCDKLVVQASNEVVFDVCNDPNERNDLSRSNGSRLASLRSAMRAKRLNVSRFAHHDVVSAPLDLGANERLNVSHDDLSVYATVNLGSGTSGVHNIYRRGEGIDLRVENGRIVATVTGLTSTAGNSPSRSVSLEAALPADGKDHRIGLVARGYFSAGTTLSLYVDGQLRSRLASPIGVSNDPGSSVLSVRSQVARAVLGGTGLSVSDVMVFTNAIEPGEF